MVAKMRVSIPRYRVPPPHITTESHPRIFLRIVTEQKITLFGSTSTVDVTQSLYHYKMNFYM